ncbi:hypothetical protein [Streptomyces sp. NPDC054975]
MAMDQGSGVHSVAKSPRLVARPSRTSISTKAQTLIPATVQPLLVSVAGFRRHAAAS